VGAASAGDAASLVFTPDAVLARVEEHGDLYAAGLAGTQDIPDLS
jgi:hypothetical protein